MTEVSNLSKFFESNFYNLLNNFNTFSFLKRYSRFYSYSSINTLRNMKTNPRITDEPESEEEQRMGFSGSEYHSAIEVQRTEGESYAVLRELIP